MVALYLSLIDKQEEKNRFEELYYRYRNLMYYIAYQVLHQDRDSEDAVQEAFFRIAKNMDKVKDNCFYGNKKFCSNYNKTWSHENIR